MRFRWRLPVCIFGCLTGFIVLYKRLSDSKYEHLAKEIDKYKTYYDLTSKWLSVHREGASLRQYFMDRGIKTIAIYGMGDLGKSLYQELDGTGIAIKYRIDRAVHNSFSDADLSVFNRDNFYDVDSVIITPIYDASDIAKYVREKTGCQTVTLLQIILEV